MSGTEIFRVPAAEFVKTTAMRRLWSIAWIPALLLLAAVIAGFADSRFWFLGLMLLFIVYPMAMSMAWFRLVGHPSMSLLLRPQSWILDGNTLAIRFHRYTSDDEGNNPDVKETLTFPATILEEAETHSKFTIVPAPENMYKIQFLLIPANLMPALITTANAS